MEHEHTVSHADVSYQLEQTQCYEKDRDIAQANLDKLYPSNPVNGELASRLAGIVGSERSRRNAHYYRYRAMFRIATNEPLFTEADNLAEASLFDLHHRLAAMTGDERAFARSMGGKGISAELGHVDQLGNWALGRELDEQIRALPNSEALAEAGFVFGDTYGEKDRAKINYRFYVSDHFESDDKDSPHHVGLKGVRKRAAADILTEDGDVFEIVKMSSFMIDTAELGSDLRGRISKMVRLSQEKKKQALDELMDEVGAVIIEPFITSPENRAKTTAAVAASSLYFALHRSK